METAEQFEVIPVPLTEAVLETAKALALRAFPAGSTVEWSDDVDENDVPLKLMTVVSPATSAATHEAYVAFVRAWAHVEPPDRRRRIRVSCRAGVLGDVGCAAVS
jgi:hypothetical protein